MPETDTLHQQIFDTLNALTCSLAPSFRVPHIAPFFNPGFTSRNIFDAQDERVRIVLDMYDFQQWNGNESYRIPNSDGGIETYILPMEEFTTSLKKLIEPLGGTLKGSGEIGLTENIITERCRKLEKEREGDKKWSYEERIAEWDKINKEAQQDAYKLELDLPATVEVLDALKSALESVRAENKRRGNEMRGIPAAGVEKPSVDLLRGQGTELP